MPGRPLQRLLILACYMLYLLLSSSPSSVGPLLPLSLPSPLPHPFISPSAGSLAPILLPSLHSGAIGSH